MTKLIKALTAIALIVLMASTAPLSAEEEAAVKKGPPPFSEFDKDGSGLVSEEEFNTTRNAHHAAMAQEGRQMKGMATAPSFTDVDTDGDGGLSEAELTAAHQAHMSKMHADHPGHGKGKGQGKGKGPCGGKGQAQAQEEDQSET